MKGRDRELFVQLGAVHQFLEMLKGLDGFSSIKKNISMSTTYTKKAMQDIAKYLNANAKDEKSMLEQINRSEFVVLPKNSPRSKGKYTFIEMDDFITMLNDTATECVMMCDKKDCTKCKRYKLYKNMFLDGKGGENCEYERGIEL